MIVTSSYWKVATEEQIFRNYVLILSYLSNRFEKLSSAIGMKTYRIAKIIAILLWFRMPVSEADLRMILSPVKTHDVSECVGMRPDLIQNVAGCSKKVRFLPGIFLVINLK